MKFRVDQNGFECLTCGSPRIEAPRSLSDEDDVHCRGCGERFGTWGEIKMHIGAALHDVRDDVPIADPLAAMSAPPPRRALP